MATSHAEDAVGLAAAIRPVATHGPVAELKEVLGLISPGFRRIRSFLTTLMDSGGGTAASAREAANSAGNEVPYE